MAQAIPMILAVVSTAATVYGQIQSSKAESKQENLIAQQETRAAEESKRASEQAALDEEQRHKALISTQEARYAASGVTAEGSPLLVKMESLKESEDQLRRIKEGGEVQSLTHKELAHAASSRAKEATTSGYVNALGTTATNAYKYDWFS
jgi:hypothetical protein